MHKRDRQSMIFGIGIGICVSIAVLFVVYIVQRQAYFNRIDELNERIFQLENFILYGDEDEGGGSAPIIIQPSTVISIPTTPISGIRSPKKIIAQIVTNSGDDVVIG